MRRRPPRSTRTDTLVPYTTLFRSYTIEDAGPVRIVALDCTIPRAGSGELCAVRLDWLTARLAEAPARPTIVALHHPPFPTGIPEIDRGGLGGPDRFRSVIAENPQVEPTVCGHFPRAMHNPLGDRKS